MKASILVFVAVLPVASAIIEGGIVGIFLWILDFIISLIFGNDDDDNGSVIDPIVQAACDAAIAALGVGEDDFDCDCNADFDLTADLSCTTTDDGVCLLGDLFCGSGFLNGTLAVDSGGFAGGLSTCLKLDAGLPLPDDFDFDQYELCIAASSDDLFSLSLDTCEASFNGESCATCEICPSGVSFTLDCTNVNISPLGDFIPFQGPMLDLCSLFTFERSAEPIDLVYNKNN